MGILGLESFLRNKCREVSISDLLDTFRKENPSITKPKIVIDGMTCIHYLYWKTCHLDWVCGGQMKEFKDACGQFLDKFKQLDVHLVFFFDGPTVEEKRQRWIQRRTKTMNKASNVFNSLKTNDLSRLNSDDAFVLPAGIGNITSFLFKIEFGCEVHISVRENDEDMALFSKRENCFAVLSQDTDFVILEGINNYLSLKDMDMKTMRTRHYDRTVLAEALNLDVKFLPLMATLSENDIIPNGLRKFYETIGAKRYNKFEKVASYINNLNIANEDDMYKRISMDVFGTETKATIINLSVNSYRAISYSDESIVEKICGMECNWKNVVREILKRHRNGEMSRLVWAIASGLPYELSTSLEDYEATDMPFACELFATARQRIYGILLKEKPLPKDETQHLVSEWVVGPDFKTKPSVGRLPAILPSVEHPGLIALWNDRSEEMKNKKWNLLLEFAEATKTFGEKLKNLDEHYMFPALSIYYLYNKNVITKGEVKALAALAIVVYNSIIEPPENRINRKAVILATLYNRAFGMMLTAITILDGPIPVNKCMPWQSFDGKIFQQIYDKCFIKNEPDLNLIYEKIMYFDTFKKICSAILNDDCVTNYSAHASASNENRGNNRFERSQSNSNKKHYTEDDDDNFGQPRTRRRRNRGIRKKRRGRGCEKYNVFY